MTCRMLARTLALTCLSATCAVAAEGITVTAAGEAKAKPTSVEMSATVSAEAELTADAVVKFNDARKKSLAAIEALKLPGLVIEAGGPTVAAATDSQQQMRMMNGMAGQTATPKTQMSESFKLTISGIDSLKPTDVMETVMKVIDTGRDAGLAVGPPNAKNYYQAQMMAQMGAGNAMAQFVVNDAAPVRAEAFAIAMKEAKAKATKLADLAGVKLGKIVSVQEDAPSSGNNSNVQMMRMIYGVSATADDLGVQSANFADIKVRVTVTVQFAIAP